MRSVRMMLPILLLVTLAAGAQTATLRLIPESTLPGIPVSFLINITNPTDRELTIDVMSLQATTGEGTFDVVNYPRETMITFPSERAEECTGTPCLRVPANGQREFLLDVGPFLGGNEFFYDSRLMKPGTYDLELTLHDYDRQQPRSVRTNAARLTVQQPTGVDLDVWNFMNEFSAPWHLVNWSMVRPPSRGISRRDFRPLHTSRRSSAQGRWVCRTMMSPRSTARWR